MGTVKITHYPPGTPLPEGHLLKGGRIILGLNFTKAVKTLEDFAGQKTGLGKVANDENVEIAYADMCSTSFEKNMPANFNETIPPGWEATVEYIKNKKEILNVYALAWWMYGQSYSPKE